MSALAIYESIYGNTRAVAESEGELERAPEWGRQLAAQLRVAAAPGGGR